MRGKRPADEARGSGTKSAGGPLSHRGLLEGRMICQSQVII